MRGRRPQYRPVPQHGFTLLELLVSMAIFVFLAAAMYGGTQYIIQQREIMLERYADLAELQRTVNFLQTDLSEIYPRSVRDELGQDRLPALLTDPGGEFVLQLSRDGWRNPANFPRGTLQRVQYRHNAEDKILYRDYWPVMDRVLGMEARERQILTGVEQFDIEFLDNTGQWQPDWPPANSTSLTGLPAAVRYRLQLETFGEVIRLVEISG